MKRCNGYNPMLWDCEKQGCFNKKTRPKIEMFADCFPGLNSFGDVDTRLEIDGHFLETEWKQNLDRVKQGQRIAFNRLVRNEIKSYTVVMVEADAESMEVGKIQTLRKGIDPRRRKCNFRTLHSMFSTWAGCVAEDEFSELHKFYEHLKR